MCKKFQKYALMKLPNSIKVLASSWNITLEKLQAAIKVIKETIGLSLNPLFMHKAKTYNKKMIENNAFIIINLKEWI